MKYRLIYLAYILLIIAPFMVAVNDSPVQSYTDFFIKGAHHATESFFSWSSENYGSNVSGSIWRFAPFSLIYYFFTNLLQFNSGVTQLIICSLLFLGSFLAFIKVVPRLLADFELSNSAIKISGLLYLFNTYTLTQFRNSYLLVIPFLLLPVQILIILKSFETKKYLKCFLLLALVNASCFGINLIFDVISMLVIVFIGYIIGVRSYEIRTRKLLQFLIGSYALTLLICSFWIVPQIYSSLTDPTTSNYVLHSEQFYNSDSSIAHVLRGLGEWGFFAGQNGTPYNSFASAYKINPLVIFAGYVIPFLALSAVFFYKTYPKIHRQITLILFALILMYVVIIGTYPHFPTSGLMAQAFLHVPFANAFRNTYKFASIEILLLCLLVAIVLSGISRKFSKKKKWQTNAALIFVVATICVNAFPFFTNQLYANNTQIRTIPTYWRSTAKYVNHQPNLTDNSIFMLPNQYFEALNWNGQQKSFSRNVEETLFQPNVVHNTCRGCGQYLTSNFLNMAYSKISVPGDFKLLGITGNSTIIQRNDYDSKYYNVETPQQIQNILSASPDVSRTRTIGKLDVYQIKKTSVNPLFYSPNTLVATDSLENFANIANQHDHSTGTILSNTVKSTDKYTGINSNYYQPVFSSSNTSPNKNYASSAIAAPRKDSYTLKKTTETNNYRVSYTSNGGAYTLRLLRAVNDITVNGHPIATSTNKPYNIELGSYGAAPIVIELQKHSFLLQPDKTQVQEIGNFAYNPADTGIRIYSTNKPGANLVSNGSLENGLWQKGVTDCAQSSAKPNISIKQKHGDASDGASSLLLTAKQDSACTYTPPLPNFKSGSYFFSFDAKRNKGSAPSYCVWDGKQCVAFSKIAAGKNWTPYSQAVYLDSTASNFYLYLYAQKANYSESQDQYDNVRIYRLADPLKTVSYNLPQEENPSQSLELNAGRQNFQTPLTLGAENLIDNGSFHDGPWQTSVQNCSNQTGTDIIKMNVVKDNKQGSSLDLYTDGTASACTASAYIGSYAKGSAYLASFKYKVIKGTQAKLCIWNGQTCIATKTVTSHDHEWHTATQLAISDKGFQPLSVYLYAPNGEASEVRYTDIDMRLIENSFINSYILSNTGKHTISQAVLAFKKDNPTRYEIDVKSTNLNQITFSQSYHPDWKAYVVEDSPKNAWENLRWSLGLWKRYQIPDSQHMVANGYANGWWINPAHVPVSFHNSPDKYHLVVDYSPQNLVTIGIIVSGATFAGILGYLLRGYLPKCKHFKGWRYAGRR